LDKAILEIIKPHYFVLSSSREVVSLKNFFENGWPYQNLTADRMRLVTPPNSNGWTIPLSKSQVFFILSSFLPMHSRYHDTYTIACM
jgi:hypothetical protein